jgi:hypothetical protein
MVVELRILGEPDRVGNAPITRRERRRDPKIGELVRTARKYVLNSTRPGTHGFSLCNDQGREFLRWFSR